jgi:hypothetical protein
MSSNSLKTDLKVLKNTLDNAAAQLQYILSAFYTDNFMDMSMPLDLQSWDSSSGVAYPFSWWAPKQVTSATVAGPIVTSADLPAYDDIITMSNQVAGALTNLGV